MNKIQILDCTLRDGGYINDFRFGKFAISKIINQLVVANVDIIECGFLEDCNYDENCSIFNYVEEIRPFLPQDRKKSMFVAMACYGEYSLDKLSVYDGTSIDGIRITFHYNEVEEALEYCRQINKKGYKVFVQPVGTTSYTDIQLIELIDKVNKLQPYSFYLVDTLGLMQREDILRMFYLVDHNLNWNIHMGFHSHNNLQLSFSNCQEFVRLESDRIISLDSSVYGMGRGAGNLNTELIANYLNEHQVRKYEIEPLLEIVDEFIVHIKAKYEWGYSVPYYLAAINGCHPTYASYLSNKQTLPVKSISSILRMIAPEKRSLFDRKLAEEKYVEFQSREIDDTAAIKLLKGELFDRNVMLLAPGVSLDTNKDIILRTIKEENCLVVSISFVPDFLEPDYVFLSNLKRYNTTFNPLKKDIRLIQTSNIDIKEDNKIIVNYSNLLNEDDWIIDNSSLMFLNLLLRLFPKHVYLAGLDGYVPYHKNYYMDRLALLQDDERIEQQNRSMKQRVVELSGSLNISFITPSLYQ
ncbi:aldolase catalytic domain-containing protein [Bacteroides sp.]|uniref:aldolase catalytic domain-containing protein n=1 Tax=Bacteroides sp. TaxID=29523 RepID=UPI0025C1A279|nr:aldolase catalytic domain-containing protein [Bacteroides sp.]